MTIKTDEPHMREVAESYGFINPRYIHYGYNFGGDTTHWSECEHIYIGSVRAKGEWEVPETDKMSIYISRSYIGGRWHYSWSREIAGYSMEPEPNCLRDDCDFGDCLRMAVEYFKDDDTYGPLEIEWENEE